ncbi:MAG: ABC transporter ATP-binding protein [Candidatus Thorarchaeota archaeon]|jgi:putative ABC transport system ATP-binding protein
MSEKLLQLKDVTMQFDDTTLFTDFNLDLDTNETVGITGPSGSGKSTVLRIAVNLLTPREGTILFKNKDIQDYDPRLLRQKMTLVPQESSMFPGTVRENLQWGLSLHKRTASKEDLQSVLEEVNLNLDCIDEIAANLSGGEKQRVSISRALLLQPEVLLLDEPTSALDEKSTLSVEKTIQSIIEERNIGVLIVTHNREQARRFTDRVVELEMRGGK